MNLFTNRNRLTDIENKLMVTKGEMWVEGGGIRKLSSVINAKKYRKTIEWEIIEISSRKLEIPREHFMQRWAQ